MATLGHVHFGQYTDNADLHPGMVYPSHGYQFLSAFVQLAGLSILSYCLARRTGEGGELWTISGLKKASWGKISAAIVFLTSWAFIFAASLLITGAGLSTNNVNCSLAIFSCVILYSASKFFIYLFLIEKIFAVWGKHGTSRMKSPIYRVCGVLLTPMVVVIAILIWGRLSVLRPEDKVCVIGLNKAASLSLLCYDLFMTFLLTSLFVYPLFKSTLSANLKKVASRTLLAAVVALMTSCANIAILTVLHGTELGWICLASCGTDVTINALAVYWVTTPGNSPPPAPIPTTAPTNNPANTARGNPTPTTIAVSIKGNSDGTGYAPSIRTTNPTTPSPTHAKFIDRGIELPCDTLPTLAQPAQPQPPRNRSSRILNNLADAWRHRARNSEDHVMNVQVTVTTERQGSQAIFDDDGTSEKYISHLDSIVDKLESDE